MEDSQIKNVLEAALLAAGRPLPLDKLVQLFAGKGPDVDRTVVRNALDSLSEDYAGRGLQLKEVASGYRVQIKSSMTNWLEPLWEERAPRYSRALLETLALIAYRQPVTRGEIEEVRGVAVNPNIVRTMLERNWIRVVGHRDVPGRPEMFGTTREFLDYFGLKSLDELPELVEVSDGFPEISPQVDFVEDIEIRRRQATGEAAANDAVDDPNGPEVDGSSPNSETMADESDELVDTQLSESTEAG
jgi:segregation and condensation protein B